MNYNVAARDMPEANLGAAQDPAPLQFGQDESTPLLLMYWQAVKRYRLLIAAIIAGCVVLGVVATLVMERQYTAISTIEISRQEQNVVDVEGVQPEDAGQNAEFYQTQYGLLRSRSLADRVVRRLNLAADEEFLQAFGIGAQGEGEPLPVEDRLRISSNVLLSEIEISPVPGSGLVDIAFRSPVPRLSQEIANAWATEFIASSQDRRFSSTSGARDFLERRLEDLRDRLEQSERELVNYARDREIVNVSAERSGEGAGAQERSLISAELEALNSSLADATARRVAAASAVGRGPSGGVENSATLNSLRSSLAQARSEYAQLLVQFEPEYPAARALQSRIDQLEASIAAESARVRDESRVSYQQALAEEEGLRARVEDAKNRLLLQQSDRIQYNIYQRDADTNRQLYDALLQRYKEIGVAGVGVSSIAIVDEAEYPNAPSSPNLLINILLGLFAGTILSGLAVLTLDQVDQSAKSPADITARLGRPVLAAVPDSKDDILEQLEDPKSAISEAYATARTSLALSTTRGLPRSMMFTSTRPAEGKTTSAFAVGRSIANLGKSVLIVDADMRNPSVHKLLGLPNEAGLSNFLTGQTEPQELIRQTEHGLSVMTAGAIPPNPSDLLSGDRIHQLFESVGGRFDVIIVDAPPVLGISDAPLLSRYVEEALYVVEAGGAKISSIAASLERIERTGGSVIGVLLTKIENDDSEYSYQYSYGDRARA